MRRPGAVRMCMTWPRSARRSRWMGRSIGTGERGFTLLELMSIVTIVGILVTMAVPSYRQSVVKAREAVLMRDLFTIREDRKSTRLNSSHGYISYAVFCLKKKNTHKNSPPATLHYIPLYCKNNTTKPPRRKRPYRRPDPF